MRLCACIECVCTLAHSVHVHVCSYSPSSLNYCFHQPFCYVQLKYLHVVEVLRLYNTAGCLSICFVLLQLLFCFWQQHGLCHGRHAETLHNWSGQT